MQPTIISLLGKPLAGKDTIAAELREQLPDTVSLSMGDLIREVKATGESHRFWPLLHESIAIADAGGVVPGEPINQCMEQLIGEKIAEGNTRIIWIAGPRNIEELTWLDTWAKAHDINTQFLHIDVPDAEVYKRLDGRKDHGRVDDAVPDVRLKNFYDITKPVIDSLRDQGRLMEINGVGEREAVKFRAVEALNMHRLDPEITLEFTQMTIRSRR